MTSCRDQQGPERESASLRAPRPVRAELAYVLTPQLAFSSLSPQPPGEGLSQAAGSWGSASPLPCAAPPPPAPGALGVLRVSSHPSTVVYQKCGLEQGTHCPSAQALIGTVEVITDPPPDPPPCAHTRGPGCEPGAAGGGGRGKLAVGSGRVGAGASPTAQRTSGGGCGRGRAWRGRGWGDTREALS